jgi:hypothetical protein
VPLGEALSFLPEAEVADDRVGAVLTGLATDSAVEGEAVRLTHGGELLAIARGDGASLKPYVVFGR